MKRICFISVVLACAFSISFAQKTKENKKSNSSVACNAEEQVNKCVQSLRPLGYKFLKSYKLEGNAAKPIEYQYTLSKGTTYFISIQPADPDAKLKVSLYDQDGRMVASSYNSAMKKFYPSIEMRCQRTGVYTIAFSHESKQDYCAASVLGFKR
jgi:hypothetical protein